MRESKLKHRLAILRTTIGIGQKEMAELAGCSASAIQRIELGDLPMSDKLVERIAEQTGVSDQWLGKSGKLDVPPVDHTRHPYTKKSFEEHRACFFPKNGKPPEASAFELLWTQQNAYWTLETFVQLMGKAMRVKKHNLFLYKMDKAAEAIAKELGIHEEREMANIEDYEVVKPHILYQQMHCLMDELIDDTYQCLREHCKKSLTKSQFNTLRLAVYKMSRAHNCIGLYQAAMDCEKGSLKDLEEMETVEKVFDDLNKISPKNSKESRFVALLGA